MLNSDLRDDVCGICNGDGSNATTVTDSAMGFGSIELSELLNIVVSQQYITFQWYLGYVDVGTIPIGAREITIMETTSSSVVVGTTYRAIEIIVIAKYYLFAFVCSTSTREY